MSKKAKENGSVQVTTNRVEAILRETTVTIPGIKLEQFTLRLVGDSPLISHAWDPKAKQQILDKITGRAKQAKSPYNAVEAYGNSLYWLGERPAKLSEATIAKGKFGFPVVAFKASAVDACSHVDGITKVEARGAFHINGELVAIDGTPEMREDMVRIAMGTTTIRHRGMFMPWTVVLPVRHNANVLTREQIVNLFNVAGFSIGVGEWRPAKDGSMGMFHVE